MLDTIRQEIHEYTSKIKQRKQDHFEMYNKFVEDMNAAVVIDSEISECEKLFVSKKDAFMSVLCRNMEKYCQMRQWLTNHVVILPRQNASNAFDKLHNKLCGSWDSCEKCNFTRFILCSSGRGLVKYISGGGHNQGNCGSMGRCNHTKLDEFIE